MAALVSSSSIDRIDDYRRHRGGSAVWCTPWRSRLRPGRSPGRDHRLGDALCGDPYYDLPSLFIGAFSGSKPLLRTLLDAYGWPIGVDFAHRAMTMTPVHEFNPLGDALPPLEEITTLHDLAETLW
jgi:hypothetical protein